jgi:CheY-like chemotaxis protein
MEFSGKKVLVVDDSEHVRFSQKLVFEELGFEVTTSDSGLDALDKLKKSAFDLVSLDIIMENMDGIECYRKIKALYPQTECILVSILATEERVVNRYSDEIGPVRFIAKPLTASELSSRLDNLFGSAEKRPQLSDNSTIG